MFFSAISSFFSLKVIHKSRIESGPGIIVCNHLRMMDVVLLTFVFRKENIVYVAKAEAFKNAFVRWFFNRMGAISIDRENADAKAMIRIVRALKQGKKVCIFPEGTRNKVDLELLPIKNGASVMAAMAKTPIFPVIQYNRFRVFHRSTIIIGEKYELTQYYGKKMTSEEMDAAGADMRERLLALQAEVREIMALPKKDRAKRLQESK
jgi:1-acyl-sn-glycerol-3-phosphate acyltransferase